MNVKLITTVIIIAIVGIFCGFNMTADYSCQINLIFMKTPKIPVSLTIICSFLFGVIVASFANLFRKKKKSDNTDKIEENVETEEAVSETPEQTESSDDATINPTV